MDATAIAILLVAAAAGTELWFSLPGRTPHRPGGSRATSMFPVVAFPLATALLAQNAGGAVGPLTAGLLLTAAAWPMAIIVAWIDNGD